MNYTHQAYKPYEALAAVYDRWTAENDYLSWVQFLLHEWKRRRIVVKRVLELCCGTGTMAALLTARGIEVTGLDSSDTMLSRARTKLGSDVPLIPGTLPDIPLSTTFDAVICAFDSINYLPTDEALAQTFQNVAHVLRPGGSFIFDLNTRRKLQDIFGSSHYGDDLDDFAYVWRNRFDAAGNACDFFITLFIKHGGAYRRYDEHHRQRVFEPSIVASLATAAGFSVQAILDNYSAHPRSEQTLRETWVLER